MIPKSRLSPSLCKWYIIHINQHIYTLYQNVVLWGSCFVKAHFRQEKATATYYYKMFYLKLTFRDMQNTLHLDAVKLTLLSIYSLATVCILVNVWAGFSTRSCVYTPPEGTWTTVWINLPVFIVLVLGVYKVIFDKCFLNYMHFSRLIFDKNNK